MKKLSYKELESELKEQELRASDAFIGFQCAMADEYDYRTVWITEPKRGDDGKYRFRLLRATSPSGGWVVQTHRFPGQRDHSSIVLFDLFFGADWFAHIPSFLHDELNKLRQRYFELNNAAKAA